MTCTVLWLVLVVPKGDMHSLIVVFHGNTYLPFGGSVINLPFICRSLSNVIKSVNSRRRRHVIKSDMN